MNKTRCAYCGGEGYSWSTIKHATGCANDKDKNATEDKLDVIIDLLERVAASLDVLVERGNT